MDRQRLAIHDISKDRSGVTRLVKPQTAFIVVCTENSNSNIMVMQSAKDRVGMDTSSSLNWAR